MKKILLILVLLLGGISNSFSQENVTSHKGDTVILLEKKSIETLNEIALHRKYLIRDLELCDSLGMIKDSLLQDKEEQIERYKNLQSINNLKIDSYNDKIIELEKNIIKKERENALLLGGGIFAFLMSILFL